jgi:hypothetical protein
MAGSRTAIPSRGNRKLKNSNPIEKTKERISHG